MTNMAPNGGNSEDLLLTNEVLTAIGDRYKHILMKTGSVTSDEILELLVTDEDEGLILETRDIVFNKAISKYATCNDLQNPDKGTSFDFKKIELKQRKGDRKLWSNCKDIYELYCYYVESRADFPKDCIRCNGTYLDVISTPGSSSTSIHKTNSKNDDVTVNKIEPQKLRSYSHAELIELVESCNLQNDILIKDNQDLERQVQNVRAHLLSVEKILFDELRAVKLVADQNKVAISGLKSDPSQNNARPADENAIRPTPGSPVQQTAENGTQATPNSQPENQQTEPTAQPAQHTQQNQPSATSTTTADGDPPEDRSFTQIMMESPDTRGDPNSSDSEESVAVDPNSNPPPPKVKSALVDKSTSPTIVRFAKNKGSDSLAHTGDTPSTQLKSRPKSPRRRPAQGQVNDSANAHDDGPWEKVSYQKKPRSPGGLRGIKNEPFEELYLSGIARNDGQHNSEIADNIREYCRNKNIRLMSAWVIRNRVTDDTVGCKLRVPVRNVDEMLGNRMWPDDIWCKRWENKQSDENGSQSSDSSRGRPPTRNTGGLSGRPRSSSESQRRTRRDNSGHRSSSRGSYRGRSGSRNGRRGEVRRRSISRPRRHDYFDGDRK